MIKLTPIRNLCFINNDIWFTSRGINALFKYCYNTKKTKYYPIDKGGNLHRDYVYLAPSCFENKLYIPPVYDKGFIEFDIETGDVSRILTPNSQRDCNFGFSYCIGEKIFCIPNCMDGPFVTFDMKEKKETQNAIFFPEEYRKITCYPIYSQKMSDNEFCGLIIPNNIIYFLNSISGEFRFLYNESIKGEINSFYVSEENIFIHVDGKIIVTDLNMNIVCEKVLDINEKIYFIGSMDGKIFADILNSPIKYLLEYKEGKIKIEKFDESATFISTSGSRYGAIQYDKAENRYLYYGGGSNGIYEFKNGITKFIKFELLEEDYIKITNDYLEILRNGSMSHENYIFNVESFVKGVTKL